MNACARRLYGILALAALTGSLAQAQTQDPNRRLIVKRHVAASATLATIVDQHQSLRRLRSEANGAEVYALAANADVEATLRTLNARSDVQYAALDRRRQRHLLPNDPLFNDQWHLQSAQAAAIAASTAWDVATGNGVVVAVLDTGVRFEHPDLLRTTQNGRLLPGYDFVSRDSNGEAATANDGDGWDADPSDPGDWIDANDQAKPLFTDCEIGDSSWHGARVSGVVGATGNNSVGVAGVSWGAYILPVRVMGKCGGYDSDILTAMRWAAGLRVANVPDNPYPAHIINLSLGGKGACTAPYQDLIAELAQRGVLVVASAGNDGGPVDEPANCPGAVAVAGLRHVGSKVGYSNLGPEVALAAPAGNCVNLSGPCLYPINTVADSGTTTPVSSIYTDTLSPNIGTSFSAPQAAGVAALMRAVNAKLSTAQLRARLQEGAQPFPAVSSAPMCHTPTSATDLQTAECNCTTGVCGAGMLHAPSAITAAQRPIAVIATSGVVTVGATATLDGSASAAACNRSLARYSWTVVATSGTAPIVSNADQAIASVAAPATGSFTLRLTVTDNTGASDFADVQITSSSAISTNPVASTTPACPVAITPPSAPANPSSMPSATSSSRGGGGDAAGLTFSLALVWLARATRRVRARVV